MSLPENGGNTAQASGNGSTYYERLLNGLAQTELFEMPSAVRRFRDLLEDAVAEMGQVTRVLSSSGVLGGNAGEAAQEHCNAIVQSVHMEDIDARLKRLDDTIYVYNSLIARANACRLTGNHLEDRVATQIAQAAPDDGIRLSVKTESGAGNLWWSGLHGQADVDMVNITLAEQREEEARICYEGIVADIPDFRIDKVFPVVDVPDSGAVPALGSGSGGALAGAGLAAGVGSVGAGGLDAVGSLSALSGLGAGGVGGLSVLPEHAGLSGGDAGRAGGESGLAGGDAGLVSSLGGLDAPAGRGAVGSSLSGGGLSGLSGRHVAGNGVAGAGTGVGAGGVTGVGGGTGVGSGALMDVDGSVDGFVPLSGGSGVGGGLSGAGVAAGVAAGAGAAGAGVGALAGAGAVHAGAGGGVAGVGLSQLAPGAFVGGVGTHIPNVPVSGVVSSSSFKGSQGLAAGLPGGNGAGGAGGQSSRSGVPAMMGGVPGSGGAQEKKDQRRLGYVAPRLKDEEEFQGRPRAAMAGRRKPRS